MIKIRCTNCPWEGSLEDLSRRLRCPECGGRCQQMSWGDDE